MTPEMLNLLIAGMQFAGQVMAQWPAIREAASTEDRERLDELYAEFQATSNAVADRLRQMAED